ncbi:MAG: hypothetical protein FWD46_02635 [Cystobacterineae bacterium]|nr:hypothetical protein [Cystobacterineae bacterium]
MKKQRGFVLLLVLGVVLGLTLAILFSLLTVQKQSDIQGMSKRNKMAQYAAEAGLNEGREILRLASEQAASQGNANVSDILDRFAVVRDFSDLGEWHDLFCYSEPPAQECNLWAPFNFSKDTTVLTADLNSKFGKLDAEDLWGGSVRYRVFAYVDSTDILSMKITDGAPIILLGLGEVLGNAGQSYRIYKRGTVVYERDNTVPVLSGGATYKGGEGNAFLAR